MSQKKPRNLPPLSVEVKRIIGRRYLSSNAKPGRLGDPCLPQLSVEVERPIAGSGQT